jgi:hypothetical protein
MPQAIPMGMEMADDGMTRKNVPPQCQNANYQKEAASVILPSRKMPVHFEENTTIAGVRLR